MNAVINNNVEDTPCWQALETMAKCILEYQKDEDQLKLRYARKEVLAAPYQLANQVRRRRTMQGQDDSTKLPIQYNNN